ncbi:hypothetical protein Tco_0690611 [Tanacetum coccineum]
MGKGSANPTDPHHTPTFIQPLTSQPQKKQKPRKPKRKDTQIPQSSGPTKHVANEAVYKELDDSLVRAATTASSLEVEQDSGGGPRRQETMGDTITQTRVLDLEKATTTQAEEIVSLKRRVKKIEQKKRSRTYGLKRLYKVGLTTRVESFRDEESLGDDASKQERINAIDVDEDITLVNDQDDANMFDVKILIGDEVLAKQEVATKDVNLTAHEITLAQALADLKSVKPKVKSNVIEEPSVPVSAASTKVSAATTTTTATISTPRKGIVITKLEPEKPLKKKDQISFDEEIASKVQAEFDEEERLTREKDEANVSLTKEWDDIQAKVDVDYQLAQRLKHFVAKRVEKKRNKPPTKIQQKKTMITYLKNIEGWKHKDLKSKDFDSIKELFDKAFKRVNMFVDYKTDLVEDSSKRAGDELEQEKVAIDVIPLATKPPTIVDWKIHKEGKKNYYHIIKADGSSKMYLVFSHMLKSFDSEDFETLWKLVKAKYGSTRPVEDLDLIL